MTAPRGAEPPVDSRVEKLDHLGSARARIAQFEAAGLLVLDPASSETQHRVSWALWLKLQDYVPGFDADEFEQGLGSVLARAVLDALGDSR